jgi:hypothetical protein
MEIVRNGTEPLNQTLPYRYRHCEESEVAIESADVFLVCELMMDFPCADYCEMTY